MVRYSLLSLFVALLNEKLSKQNMKTMNAKLIEEEGFSQEDVKVVNKNMIFFKSVSEIKKRG
jgi:hypothetical protein